MDTFDRTVIAIMGALVAAIVVEAAIGDRAGAGIVSLSPPDGSSPAVTTSIQIEFSQPMDQPGVEKRLTISPAVEGKIRWNGNTLAYTPARALSVGQQYEVTLGSGAQSLLGRPVSRDVRWTFSPRPLSVVYLSPAQADEKVLWMIARTGGQPREIFRTAHGIDSFAVRPDGSQIAVTTNGDGEAADIWLLDPRTGSSRQITTCAPDYCGHAAWSPDGQRLAYEQRRNSSGTEGASAQIWLYDFASSVATPLFQDRSLAGFGPDWSPDGGRIAFFDPQAQAIDVVDLSSGAILYLPSQMGAVGSFSPDGAEMVYDDFRAVGAQVFSELWIGSVSGDGRITELLADAQEDQFPSWSPDGRWIAFGRRRLDRKDGFGSQLTLFNPATSQLRQLTADPAYNNTSFAWSPSSDTILVQRFDMQAAPGGGAIWAYSLADDHFAMIAADGYGAAWLP